MPSVPGILILPQYKYKNSQGYVYEEYSIGRGAFYCQNNIVSIGIRKSINAIGTHAFYKSKRISEVINCSSKRTIERGKDSNGYVGKYAREVRNSTNDFALENIFTTEVENFYYHYPSNQEEFPFRIIVRYFGDAEEVQISTNPSSSTYEIASDAFLGNHTMKSLTLDGSFIL